MRKVDYKILAQIIRAQRNAQIDIRTGRVKATSPSMQIAHSKTLGALDSVAFQFADGASVNKAEFLKACGIE
jgi:hypothetical protein